MSNPRPLIHIGYPKAASTWLQQVIFKDENAGFLDPWGVHSLEALKQFAFPNPFRFSAESARQVFEPGLQEAARKELVPVLSREALVGNPIWGHYWGKDVADRMHAVFPEAKIFISHPRTEIDVDVMLSALYQSRRNSNASAIYWFGRKALSSGRYL